MEIEHEQVQENKIQLEQQSQDQSIIQVQQTQENTQKENQEQQNSAPNTKDPSQEIKQDIQPVNNDIQVQKEQNNMQVEEQKVEIQQSCNQNITQELSQQEKQQNQNEALNQQTQDSMQIENKIPENVQAFSEACQDMHIEIEENSTLAATNSSQETNKVQNPQTQKEAEKPKEQPQVLQAQNNQSIFKIPIPIDFSWFSVSQFVHALKQAGKITEEEFKYLMNVVIQLKYNNIRVQQVNSVLNAFKQCIDQDQLLVQQNMTGCQNESSTYQMQKDQNANQQQGSQQFNKPNQKSYLVKQGDREEVKAEQEKTEDKQPAKLLSFSGSVSTNQQISREEMEAQRRQRYVQLEKEAEKKRKEQEEQIKKQQAYDAFWKSGGGKMLGQH